MFADLIRGDSGPILVFTLALGLILPILNCKSERTEQIWFKYSTWLEVPKYVA